MLRKDAVKPGAAMEPVDLNLGGSWGVYIRIPHHSQVEGCTQGMSAPWHVQSDTQPSKVVFGGQKTMSGSWRLAVCPEAGRVKGCKWKGSALSLKITTGKLMGSVTLSFRYAFVSPLTVFDSQFELTANIAEWGSFI